MSADPGVIERLESARAIALEAQGLILGRFAEAGACFDRKMDGSPVTAADRDAEDLIRGRIERAWAADGLVGEEHGRRDGTSEYRWVIDPIDGTRAFIHGVPLFGTLIGVQRRTAGGWSCVAGVARFPALDECIWGAAGAGAWHTRRGEATPRACRVSRTARLADATVCFTSPQAMLEVGERSAAAPRGTREAFIEINRRALLTRGWSDCYGVLLVATGRIDAMIDPPMQLWDVAALVPIVEEAGGRLTGWDGCATDGTTGALASNGRVHEELVALLGAAG